MPAAKGTSSSGGCLLERESQYGSQHFTRCEIMCLSIQITFLVLVVWSECPSPGQVCSGGDGSDRAIPTFHQVRASCIAGSWQGDALPPSPHPLVKTSPRRTGKAGCPRSKCGVPFSQHQRSFASGAAVPRLHNAGVALVKQQISYFLPGQPPWEAAMRHWDLGPGLELPTAATSREQEVATDSRASPSVTKQF